MIKVTFIILFLMNFRLNIVNMFDELALTCFTVVHIPWYMYFITRQV